MPRPQRGEPVQKDVVLDLLDAAIEHSSGNGQYEFSLRQLSYAVQPGFKKVFGRAMNYETFADIITGYESELGRDIDGMYRDDRGLLYEPHTQRAIPLGTRSVRSYERPEWTFNKILYIEKGGFISLLRQANWPERHDCAILTSQGYPTRAVRDLFDTLGETDEALTFFCVHDADGYGTTIYQSLIEATRARAARRVEVINLGLDPDEAVEMGLQVEPVRSKQKVPAADYIADQWREWLQTNRVELNAMTSPQFIEWLDRKMEPYDGGKVIPPIEKLTEVLNAEIDSLLHDQAEDIVRRHFRIDWLVGRVKKHLRRKVDPGRVGELRAFVEGILRHHPLRRWSIGIAAAAAYVTEGIKP